MMSEEGHPRLRVITHDSYVPQPSTASIVITNLGDKSNLMSGVLARGPIGPAQWKIRKLRASGNYSGFFNLKRRRYFRLCRSTNRNPETNSRCFWTGLLRNSITKQSRTGVRQEPSLMTWPKEIFRLLSLPQLWCIRENKCFTTVSKQDPARLIGKWIGKRLWD